MLRQFQWGYCVRWPGQEILKAKSLKDCAKGDDPSSRLKKAITEANCHNIYIYIQQCIHLVTEWPFRMMQSVPLN